MGNRGGMFHDPATGTLAGRRWASRRWLCCVLDYPGSHRHPVWSRGYTQLFFADEVTALAAGHRPCAECRRADALAFRAAVGGGGAGPSLAELDTRLHAERIGPARAPVGNPRALPDGAMFAVGHRAYALRGGRALPWSASGYGAAERPRPGPVAVLTPPTSLAALAAGYRPLWHPTAGPPAILA